MIVLNNEILFKIEKSEKPYLNSVRRLRRMLKQEEPELVRIVARQLKSHQNTISYTDLRESIVRGELTESIWKSWNEDYSHFIKEKMYPYWIKAMKEGAEELKQKKSSFQFDIEFEETQKWLNKHGGELIVQLSDTQRSAVSFLIEKVAKQEVTADTLGIMIRPVIGLHKRQTVANWNYFKAVYAGLLTANPRINTATAEKKALEAAAKYAEKQHRYRAMNIARTELATGYNAGEYYSIKQAQHEGLLGRMKKRVSTAGDGRVCGDCQNVDGAEAEMKEEFPNGYMFPPFHPSCRCCVEYIEVEAPTLKAMKEVKKRMDFKVSKTNEDKKQVFGWANIAVTKEGTPIQDLQNDMVEPEELEKAAYGHVLSFRSTGEQHDPNLRQKGRLIESIVFTKEKLGAMNIPEGTVPYGWWVGYQIDDDTTWAKIKKGEYQMFSIEGTAQRQPIDKSKRIAKSYRELVNEK